MTSTNTAHAVVWQALRRFALPTMSALLLRTGIVRLILAANTLLLRGLAETTNFVIRRGFPDTIEIAVDRFPIEYYVRFVATGLLSVSLGLAVAFWVSRRRFSSQQTK